MPLHLPLFPLHVVLFPGTRQPLHIFESRYQQLLHDVLAGDQRFGLIPPGDGNTIPPIGTVGCLARVVVHQPFPDGRANIVVSGEGRFVLRGWLDEGTPYLRGTVEPFDDDPGAPALPGDTLDTLRRLGERCRLAMAALTDEPPADPWADDAAALTFQIAGALPWVGDQARRILALRSGAERADVLLSVLPRIVPDLESRAATHKHATTNGKGRHHPELGEST